MNRGADLRCAAAARVSPADGVWANVCDDTACGRSGGIGTAAARADSGIWHGSRPGTFSEMLLGAVLIQRSGAWPVTFIT